jgi:hypothetical protein
MNQLFGIMWPTIGVQAQGISRGMEIRQLGKAL